MGNANDSKINSKGGHLGTRMGSDENHGRRQRATTRNPSADLEREREDEVERNGAGRKED